MLPNRQRSPPQRSIRRILRIFKATNSLGVAASQATVITVGTGKPTLRAVVNTASYSSELACSPGALATLFGTDLTEAPPAQATALPLPTELAGLKVKVNDKDAPLLYASASQVNFQCPDLNVGEKLSISVEVAGEVSTAFETTMLYATPGIFTVDGSGGGQGAVLLAGSPKLATLRRADLASQPALPGDYVSIYAQGLGPVRDGPAIGCPAAADPLAYLNPPIRATVGGVDAEVSFAGLAPGFVGLYQVNVKIPSAAPTGDAVPVLLEITGPDGKVQTTNTVTIAIERGA